MCIDKEKWLLDVVIAMVYSISPVNVTDILVLFQYSWI
jgi:hypothetical protein